MLASNGDANRNKFASFSNFRDAYSSKFWIKVDVEKGRQILADADFDFIVAGHMADAAEKAVASVARPHPKGN